MPPRRKKPPGMQRWTWEEINLGRKLSRTERRYRRVQKTFGLDQYAPAKTSEPAPNRLSNFERQGPSTANVLLGVVGGCVFLIALLVCFVRWYLSPAEVDTATSIDTAIATAPTPKPVAPAKPEKAHPGPQPTVPLTIVREEPKAPQEPTPRAPAEAEDEQPDVSHSVVPNVAESDTAAEPVPITGNIEPARQALKERAARERQALIKKRKARRSTSLLAQPTAPDLFQGLGPFPDDPGKSVYVRGYYRSNGTYVQPYYRRPPSR